MNELTTPGKRLRYFCDTFFSSVTVFAHEMGFSKPGSLYDYFNDTKKPGGLVLDKLQLLGGNPLWLRYGTRSMFANNDAGKQRQTEYRNKFPFEPEPEEIAPTGEIPAQQVQPSPSFTAPSAPSKGVVPETPAEAVYLFLSAVQFRLHRTDSLSKSAAQLYRNLTKGIAKELDRLEKNNQPESVANA